VKLDTERLDVICTICTPCEIRQVELDLVPSFVKSHWHCTYEGLHTRCALVVGGTETPTHFFVIQHGDFKGKVLLQVLQNPSKPTKTTSSPTPTLNTPIGPATIPANQLLKN